MSDDYANILPYCNTCNKYDCVCLPPKYTEVLMPPILPTYEIQINNDMTNYNSYNSYKKYIKKLCIILICIILVLISCYFYTVHK